MPHPVRLRILPGDYVVCRLDADAPWPDWAAGEFVALSRTPDELSVVCEGRSVPAGVRREDGWRCLAAAGPLDFALVGVVAGMVGPLATAGISVFVVSTYDTDYLLVKAARLEAALEALRQAGHVVET
jgi:uncharacterized protein